MHYFSLFLINSEAGPKFALANPEKFKYGTKAKLFQESRLGFSVFFCGNISK